MIRVVIGKPNPFGVYQWFVATGYVASGRSRKPLLEACRVLKSMGVDPHVKVGLFRENSVEAALTVACGVGAELDVVEPKGGTIRFCKYTPYSGPVSEEDLP